jgi:hypothetical protein
MRWTGYAARLERSTYNVSVGKPEAKRPLEDLYVDCIIFIWILKKQERKLWAGFVRRRTGSCGRLLRKR